MHMSFGLAVHLGAARAAACRPCSSSGTARSFACCACTRWRTSSTTSPSSASTVVVAELAAVAVAAPDAHRHPRHGVTPSRLRTAPSARPASAGAAPRVTDSSSAVRSRRIDDVHRRRTRDRSREVVAGVRAAALLALERRARDASDDREQSGRGPARGASRGCTAGCPSTPTRVARSSELLQLAERLAQLVLGADDADVACCIVSCSVVLDRVRVLAARAVERSRAPRAASALDRPPGRPAARTPCAVAYSAALHAGAPAEHEQVRERVAAEAVRRRACRRATRPRRTGRARSTACVSASTRTPPIM